MKKILLGAVGISAILLGGCGNSDAGQSTDKEDVVVENDVAEKEEAKTAINEYSYLNPEKVGEYDKTGISPEEYATYDEATLDLRLDFLTSYNDALEAMEYIITDYAELSEVGDNIATMFEFLPTTMEEAENYSYINAYPEDELIWMNSLFTSEEMDVLYQFDQYYQAIAKMKVHILNGEYEQAGTQVKEEIGKMDEELLLGLSWFAALNYNPSVTKEDIKDLLNIEIELMDLPSRSLLSSDFKQFKAFYEEAMNVLNEHDTKLAAIYKKRLTEVNKLSSDAELERAVGNFLVQPFSYVLLDKPFTDDLTQSEDLVIKKLQEKANYIDGNYHIPQQMFGNYIKAVTAFSDLGA